MKSVKFGDKEYALVPERLKRFREENPRAEVTTKPIFNDDGSVVFEATIIRDRKDEFSPVSTGHAMYSATEIKKTKAFEKLETISVGRALANIGYLNDGQIATTEEMEEFEAFKSNKVDEAILMMESADTLDELKERFLSLGNLTADRKVVLAKDLRKQELQKHESVKN